MPDLLKLHEIANDLVNKAFFAQQKDAPTEPIAPTVEPVPVNKNTQKPTPPSA